MTAILPPGPHGGDATLIAHALGVDPATMIDLSASTNPFAPDVVALIVEILDRDPGILGRYPNAAPATVGFAAAIGVDPDRVVLTNGGAEAIALVAAETEVGCVIDPEFSLYRRYLTIDPDAPRWRSNPSNPLGALAAESDVAGVWDEAFYPLATGKWTGGDTTAWRLGSLTKLWNCPGLRLGYILAPDAAAANRVRHRQPQWAVNSLALAVIPELLARTDLPGWHSKIDDLRVEFTASLETLGYRVQPTVVNWVLVDQPDLRSHLACQRVVVRDCTSFGLPDLHRVALPHPDDFDRVVTAFAAARIA